MYDLNGFRQRVKLKFVSYCVVLNNMKSELCFTLGLFTLITIGLYSCKPDEGVETKPFEEEPLDGLTVEKVQRSLIWNWSTTELAECGDYSNKSFYGLIEEFSDNELIGIEFHSFVNSYLTNTFNNPNDGNRPYTTYTFNEGIEDYLNYNDSFPLLRLNNEFVGGVSVNSNAVSNEIRSYNQQEPLVGTTAKASVEDDIITVITKIEFFKEAQGKYLMSALFIEDEVVSIQKTGSGLNSNYLHKNVLRGSASRGTVRDQFLLTGEYLFDNSIDASTEINDTFRFKHEVTTRLQEGFVPWELQPQNLSVVVIVWELDGSNKLIFKNAAKVKVT